MARAILTERERELIRDDRDEIARRRSASVSQVRNKIHDELPEDLHVLREHHPTLFSELVNVVAEAAGTEWGEEWDRRSGPTAAAGEP